MSPQVYLPPDANCLLSTVDHCLKSKNLVNLVIGSKNSTPVYLSPSQAADHCRRGVAVWRFASTHDGADPDVVLVGIGVEVTFEVVKAVELLREISPDLRVRAVNVTDLFVLAAESRHPHALTDEVFGELFALDRPVLFNYHGYATELQGLLFGRPNLHRMQVNGYREEGSTTTPFDMLLRNQVSRFDVARRALQAAAESSEPAKGRLEEALGRIDELVEQVQQHIYANGKGER